MAIYKVQGLQLAIASTFGTTKNMTAVSNAVEAVATLEASHGVLVGDIIEVTSGWTRLNKRVVRAGAVATNDVTLEDVDTSSTTNYPATEGTGTVREITAWTSLSQLRPDFSVEGGGFEQDDITQITDFRRTTRPGLQQAVNMNFTAFADPALAWLSTVRAASEGAVLTPFRIILSSGAKIYGNAYWGLTEEPQPDANSLIYRIQLGLAVNSITYAS